MIPTDYASYENARAGLGSEARANAAVSGHPNIMQVHDARMTRSSAYIEMEYIQGRSVRELMTPGIPMTISLTLKIASQLCEAMAYAHEIGVIHRDLKPSNLMVVDGRPLGPHHLKVIDFGLAEFVGGVGMRLHKVGCGTPGYSAPEQLRGEPVDARADIYSTGVMLYRFLTGHLPFDGSPKDRIAATLFKKPPPFSKWGELGTASAHLERFVMQCLDKNPDLRPQSATELGDRIADLIG